MPKVCIVILVNILADAYAISGQNRIEKKIYYHFCSNNGEFLFLMSRWTLKFLQILKDRGSVINAPDDHYHLLMMFSFAFPMDSLLVDDPC